MRYFNPLPPYGGRPITPDYFFRRFYISIHSLRMEGDIALFDFGIWEKLSIHSLRMEGDLDDARENRTLTISIHSLRMEGDSSFLLIDFMVHHFNPLPPYGGRLLRSRLSIDCVINFNPLPPYGGRRRNAPYSIPINLFQSTPSVWRETISVQKL